jgi:pSer/pThr/pTyr-binding forkhead associated (FHA) protein
MESKSKENKTSSIKEEKIEYTEEISAEILEDIRKIPEGKSGLIVIKGPNTGDKFFINKPEFTIGRNTESDLFLDDITVSRKHASIIKEGSDFRIKDSGSLNGSYLNGKIVEDAILKDMDRIQIGKYIFLFFYFRRNARNIN